jgi:hypothetical protein
LPPSQRKQNEKKKKKKNKKKISGFFRFRATNKTPTKKAIFFFISFALEQHEKWRQNEQLSKRQRPIFSNGQ